MNVPQTQSNYPRPPNKELMREVAKTKSGRTYAITCNKTADRFYLYEVAGDGSLSKRVASSANPPELKAKMK